MASLRYQSAGLFVLISVLFGCTFIAINVGLTHLPPLLFLAFRFDIAALLLLPYVYLSTDDWIPRTKRDFWGVLAGTVTIGVTNSLLFVGQQYVVSAVGAIIFSFIPILTPAFAYLLLSDEYISSRDIVGLTIAFLGVGLVIRPDPTLLTGNLLGRAILLIGATCGALGTVLIRRADASVPSVTLVAWALPPSALLLHLSSAAAGESIAAAEWTLAALAALGYVSTFAGIVTYIVYFELLDSIGAVKTNSFNFVAPIITALAGWILLGETLTVLSLVGFSVIVTGFLVLEYPILKEEFVRFRY